MRHHRRTEQKDLSVRLTWSVLTVCWIHCFYHLFALGYLLLAPNSLMLSRYPVMGLTALEILLLGSVSLVVWSLLHWPHSAHGRTGLLNMISFCVLVSAACGNLAYTTILCQAELLLERDVRASLNTMRIRLRDRDDLSERLRHRCESEVRYYEQLLGESGM